MSDHGEPEPRLFDRPVPEALSLDIDGLVESWVAEAEDWLTAYMDLEILTPREAFEGIELYGKLSRCKNELLGNVDGTSTLGRLRELIGGEAGLTFVELAIGFPDIKAWRAQAEESWEIQAEDEQLIEVLLCDLDAIEFLLWAAETAGEDIESNPALSNLQENLTQCQVWLNRHRELFVVGEAYICAVAKTIPESLDADDWTGRLALSAVKYTLLLDTLEASWQESTHISSIDFLKSQPAYGRIRLDWTGVPQLAHAAGASKLFKAPRSPMRWHDPTGSFEATVYLPQGVVRGESTEIELLFGTGTDYAQPAHALVDAVVHLGGALGTVELVKSGDLELTRAILIFEEVAGDETSEINLCVEEKYWE